MKPSLPVIMLEAADAAATMRIGAAIAKACVEGDIVALEGDLGAGKTQFVRGLARGMGLDEKDVSSPTFVTVQEYWPQQGTTVLVHIDAWRMEGDGHELEAIGWGEDGGDLRCGAVVAVEWPGRMGSALGHDFLQVRLVHADGGTRRIFIAGHGAWKARMETVGQAVESAGFHPAAPVLEEFSEE